jgi:Cu+-exporting ATPase
VAIEAADVVLVRQDLRAVAETIALSRATLRTIRQTEPWLGVPLQRPASAHRGGRTDPDPWAPFHLPPAAAAAMAASSVSVVTNSLLLWARRLDV